MAASSEWLGRSIVLLFLLLYTVTAGVVFCYSTLSLYIEDDFNIKLTMLEWLGALPASVQGLAAPLAMWLTFRFGPGWMILVGTVLTTLGLGLSCAANSFGLLFFSYGGVVSVGILLIMNPPYYLIDQIYPYDHPRHVLATSITACGYPLASLIITPVCSSLVEAIGWHLNYLILAVTVLLSGIALSVPAMLWSRRVKEHVKIGESKAEDNPERQPEAGESQLDTNNTQGEEKQSVYVSTSLKAGVCIIWTLASVSKCIAYYTPMLTLLKQMDTLGIPRSVSWPVMPVIGGSELVSRLVASYVGDYFKGYALYMYAAFCAMLALINILGSFATTYVHFMLYGAGLGVFGGPIIVSLYSCSAEVLYGQQVPLIFSLFRTGIGAACMLGPVIAGGIHDQLGTFHPIFYLYTALYTFATLIYIFIILLNKYHRPISQGDDQTLFNGVSMQVSYQTLSNDHSD